MWVVSFPILRPFGPFPVNTMLRAGASSNLYRRALEAMDKDTRSKHDQTTVPLQTEDPLRDEARLNRLRLLLTWTTAPNGLFQLYDIKHKTHVHRVGLTGPSLLKDHIATLFPPSVEYAFISGERHVYTALLAWTPSSHSDELFVGGVSKRMKAVELQTHFEQFGSVENVEVITDKTGADAASSLNLNLSHVVGRRRHAPDGQGEDGQSPRGHGGPRWKA